MLLPDILSAFGIHDMEKQSGPPVIKVADISPDLFGGIFRLSHHGEERRHHIEPVNPKLHRRAAFFKGNAVVADNAVRRTGSPQVQVFQHKLSALQKKGVMRLHVSAETDFAV